MAEASNNFLGTKRYAVVTGANKGIGFEICWQLASHGVKVVLTARDEKSGLEALEKLKHLGLSHLVVFHRLDVAHPATIASLADFIKTDFGKLDILESHYSLFPFYFSFFLNSRSFQLTITPTKRSLISNAYAKAAELAGGVWPEQGNWDEIAIPTYELAEECIKVNYHGIFFVISSSSCSIKVQLISIKYHGKNGLHYCNLLSFAFLFIYFLFFFSLSSIYICIYIPISYLTFHTLITVSPTMAEVSTFLETKRYAVVTGANKGIGFEICKQLASNGVKVVLTARDEKRGLEAIQILKESGLSQHVVFHCLDVTDPASIASFADFITTQFGKLDILINNAGIGGVILDADAFAKAAELAGAWPDEGNWNEISTPTYELAEECLKTNYYGARRLVEALLPLLQLSDSPRVVNVSSDLGLLKNLSSEWAKQLLNDVENLTEERVDEDNLEKRGWPVHTSAYRVSKAALNAYTRILAKNYPNFCVNSVCPGYCITDITCNTGQLTAAEGAQSAVSLALLPEGRCSGLFFLRQQLLPF
ncbi:hypothetical protein UlMin_028749 [Ulmus minor]